MQKYLIPAIIMFAMSCTPEPSEPTLFTKVGRDETGIDFRNILQPTEKFNIIQYPYFYNGAGVAIGDFNNDGLQDLVFTGNMVKNRLYINKGHFEFEDITQQSGIADSEGWCTGVNTVDVNQDGHLDIYICRSGYPFQDYRSNLLYINNGDLTFTESAKEYNLNDVGYSTQSAFFDYDEDGDLDMFLANQSSPEYARGNLEVISLRNRKNPVLGNKLFQNQGGVFKDVTEKSGITSNVLTFSLGLSTSDINNDGFIDIYVGNDFSEPDYLYINNGDGTFTDMANAYFDHMSLYTMGIDAADFNNDGFIDIVSLDMLPESNELQKMHAGMENFDKNDRLVRNGFHHQYSRNTLQVNNGDGTFAELGRLAGISNTDWSWSPLFADFDNDGYKDLFVSNGYTKDYTDLDFVNYSFNKSRHLKATGTTDIETYQEYISKMPDNIISNYIFQNNQSLQFDNKTKAWGLDSKSISQGAAYVDLDNDGDLDLVINNSEDYASVYRNNTIETNLGQFLVIKLEGDAPNKNAIGSKVELYAEQKLQVQELLPTRGFQSQSQPILNFGLNHVSKIDSVLVTWPDGVIQVLKNPTANQFLLIKKVGKSTSIVKKKTNEGLLVNSPGLFDFTHEENKYNDFKSQGLLPEYLSRSGPCMAQGDINGDGQTDIFLGGSRGFTSKLYLSDNGELVLRNLQVLAQDSLSEDVDAKFIDVDGDSDLDLYVVSGGSEFKISDPLLQDRLYINDGRGSFQKSNSQLPKIEQSGSSITASDFDKDGDIDMFIGARLVPGRYPTSPSSQLLVNDGNGFFHVVAKHTVFDTLGMVTDALFTDINLDGWEDLIVVGEWMPIVILINHDGDLVDESDQYIDFKSNGWWNVIHADDFDGDGDEDYFIGNLGQNSQMKVTSDKPATLIYSDFDENGSLDPILNYYIGETSYPYASRDDLLAQLPHLKKKYVDYKSYALTTTEDIKQLNIESRSEVLSSYLGKTTYLENTQGKLVSRELPIQAQTSSVYALTSHDFNGDGYLDVIMAGNNTHTRLSLGPYDANHGMLLLGNGKGNFTYTGNTVSGLKNQNNTRFLQKVKVGNTMYFVFGVNDSHLKWYVSSDSDDKVN